MSLAQSQKDFLNILSSVFQNSKLDLPEELEWFTIFQIADKQRLLPQVFEKIYQEKHGEELNAFFIQVKSIATNQVAEQIGRNLDIQHIYHRMREHDLHPIMLKGPLCSELYPKSSHRITADFDLFIAEEEFDACHQILTDFSMIPQSSKDDLNQDYEISYFSRDKKICVELHHALFDEQQLNAFFNDAFSQGQEHGDVLTLSPGLHMLFLVLHAYKHFIFSGVGIRQVCDIGLWAREYGNEIDWQWLFNCCDSVDAAIFAASVFQIARKDIGISFEIPEYWINTARESEPLLLDMFDGGIYGSESLTRLHTATATVNAVKASRGDKKRYSLVQSIFLPREKMQGKYSYVKKYPVLLPIAWMERIGGYIIETMKKEESSATGSVQLIKKRMQLLRDYGVVK